MRVLRLLLLLACFAPAMLRAQLLFWDTDGAAGGPPGDGTWDLTATNWTTDASGLSPTTTWTNGATAWFGATAPTIITLGSGVQASTINFQAVQYTLTGGTELTLTGGTISSQYVVNLDVTLNSAGLDFAGDFHLNTASPNLTGVITNTYNLTYNHPDAISNNAGTSILNNGQLTFDYVSGGDFNYTVNNPITINGGSLYIDFEIYGNRSVNLTGPITLATDGQLYGGTINDFGQAQLAASGVISGAGRNVEIGGDVALSGTNTFTGTVIVGNGTPGRVSVPVFNNKFVAGPLGAGGSLQLGKDLGLGMVYDGEVVYTGGVGAVSSDRPIAIEGDVGGIGVSTLGAVLTLSGTISSSGANGTHDLEKTGQGSLILTGSNTFAGDTLLANGTLVVGSNSALGTGAEVEVGTAKTGSSDALNLLLLDTVILPQEVHVYNENNDGGSTRLGNYGTGGNATFGGDVYIERSIYVGANAGGGITFTGEFTDGNGGGSILKEGAGVAIFSGGIDLRGGGMDVTAGTVQLTGSVILAETLDVQSGATLTGTPTITNAITTPTVVDIHAGGTLSPGLPTGTLSMPSLILESGSFVKWELGALTTSSLAQFDNLQVNTGAADFQNINAASTLTVDLTLLSISLRPTNASPALNDPFWQTAQFWDVVDFTGAGSNSLTPGALNPMLVANGVWAGGTFDTFVGGGAGAFSAFNAGDIYLRFTPAAVPEPSTCALLGLGAALLGLRRLRRRA